MVNYPVNELKLVNRNMNKNGILMVDVPDFNSVTQLIDFFRYIHQTFEWCTKFFYLKV